jgi:branched-chain amino acid transport system ATP-binding protein
MDKQNPLITHDVFTAKDITVSFGGLVALNKLNMAVKQREIRGLIGANGAGKTTFFNVITGYIFPKEGSIEFYGQKIPAARPHIIAGMGITRTYQLGGLFKNITVFENVLVGLHKSIRANFFGATIKSKKIKLEEERAREKALGLIKELGIIELADRTAGNLSVGQQRLAEIARALVGEPRLLLLDEPTSGLNPVERENLRELLKRIRAEREVTMIVTDHIIDLIMRISDNITVINYGEKIAEGAPEEIRNNKVVIDAYLGD